MSGISTKTDDEYKKAMGERIYKIRQDQNMTQVEFSKAIGLGRDSLSSIENGRFLPTLAVLRRIRQRFRISYEYLLDGR